MKATDLPKRYTTVEHADGVVHVIDADEWTNDIVLTSQDWKPLYRQTPVCGAATGVSSDEGGIDALGKPEVTCTACESIVG